MKSEILLATLSAVVCLGVSGMAAPASDDWPQADRACRPWAYNWWLGSAVDKENLARELKRYAEGGLGGIHIVPIYGVNGAETRDIDYLSPRWMEMMAFAVKEGEKLGIGVDMTTGTGWCFGGPGITRELGGRKLVLRRFPAPADGKLPPQVRSQKSDPGMRASLRPQRRTAGGSVESRRHARLDPALARMERGGARA